jgi:hypothetical protein
VRKTTQIRADITQYIDINHPSIRASVYLPMPHELLGPHPLQKKLILYGYCTLDTSPQQLANYLLILAKTAIYKTYWATNSSRCHIPDYQRMFRLQYRLCRELQYTACGQVTWITSEATGCRGAS